MKKKDNYMDAVRNPFGSFKEKNTSSDNDIKQPDTISIRKGWGNNNKIEHNIKIALNA